MIVPFFFSFALFRIVVVAMSSFFFSLSLTHVLFFLLFLDHSK